MNMKDPVDKAAKRSSKLYEQFAQRFQEDIVYGTPAEGTTRMDVLEDLLLGLHQAQHKSDMLLAQDLIERLDEEEIIASKKANS